MRLIQRYLPNPQHVELHRITVHASPEVAWRAARHFNAAKIPWVRWLFGLRTLPSRWAGATPEAMDRNIGIDQIAASSAGFRLLEEQPGREVVVGAIGEFWRTQIPFVTVDPADFAAFDTPGWAKLAWAIRVEPFGTGSQIALELRTTATDSESWKKLDRYFRIIGMVSRWIRTSVMAHLEERLGPRARPHDEERALRGDELLGGAHYTLTHAIDIEAPPSMVWPWLMQLGCDRGGWYSIDALDHGGVPSVDRLRPEWRTRGLGDCVQATPKLDGGYRVLAVKPNELFVIGADTHRLGGHVAVAWAFVLEPLGDDATHLVTRVRARGTPQWSEWLQGTILYPPVHAIMQRTQLENLKRLAEREAFARAWAAE
ncbi:MAG TPA: hypothetical protein VHM19_18190 [Polyangiales bacterium]|jgi:hypothetical protein|nr:hypothetical protein [Polyangiales bacterium]